MDEATDIRCVADVRAILGEGPLWVPGEQALYWVDVHGRTIFRLTGGEVERFDAPWRIGSLAPRTGGGFIAGTDQGVALIDPAAGRYDLLVDPEPDLPGNRFNDGKVDRAGRFWAGTMDDAERTATGTLYRIDADRRWAAIDTGYRVTNGPAFSADGRILYHGDSARRTIYAFDLDQRGGASNRRILVRFGDGDGHPDGMTVDAEGCLWVAFWDGGCLRRLGPDGAVLATIEMPVRRPTSCAFGGAALDRLYVTSARTGLDEGALAMQPYAGGLFMFEPGVTGIAEQPFAG